MFDTYNGHSDTCDSIICEFLARTVCEHYNIRAGVRGTRGTLRKIVSLLSPTPRDCHCQRTQLQRYNIFLRNPNIYPSFLSETAPRLTGHVPVSYELHDSSHSRYKDTIIPKVMYNFKLYRTNYALHLIIL